MTAHSVWARSLLALGLVLTGGLAPGCHELGNPVARATPAEPYPETPPHLTITVLRYARTRDAVAWARPPAHALDPRVGHTPFVGRVEVRHPELARAPTVELETEIVMQAGGRFRKRWFAPATAEPWLADVALPGPVRSALTRVIR